MRHSAFRLASPIKCLGSSKFHIPTVSCLCANIVNEIRNTLSVSSIGPDSLFISVSWTLCYLFLSFSSHSNASSSSLLPWFMDFHIDDEWYFFISLPHRYLFGILPSTSNYDEIVFIILFSSYRSHTTMNLLRVSFLGTFPSSFLFSLLFFICFLVVFL